MKKIVLLLLYIIGVQVQADIFNKITNNANFLKPIETSALIFEKKSFHKYLIQKKSIINKINTTLKTIKKVDLSRVKERGACVYQEKNKRTILYFTQKNHQWIFLKSSNPKIKFDKDYYEYHYNQCYEPSFISSFELVDSYIEVYDILSQKNRKIFNTLLRFRKVYPTQKSFIHGWLLESIHLRSNKKYNKIYTKSIPTQYRTFFVKKPINKRLGHFTKGKNGGIVFHKAPKVKMMQCRQFRDRIRVTFRLDKENSINSFLERIENEYQRSYFGVNATSIKVINCAKFLKIENKRGLTIDLRKLRKNISSISYGKSMNSSYIDYHFQGQITLSKKKY